MSPHFLHYPFIVIYMSELWKEGASLSLHHLQYQYNMSVCDTAAAAADAPPTPERPRLTTHSAHVWITDVSSYMSIHLFSVRLQADGK